MGNDLVDRLHKLRRLRRERKELRNSINILDTNLKGDYLIDIVYRGPCIMVHWFEYKDLLDHFPNMLISVEKVADTSMLGYKAEVKFSNFIFYSLIHTQDIDEAMVLVTEHNRKVLGNE